MNASLLNTALTVIPDARMLVNVVRLRVKQLSFGHRPLVTTLPGLGLADIALTEIVDGKLGFESTGPAKTANPEVVEPKVVPFPEQTASRKEQAA